MGSFGDAIRAMSAMDVKNAIANFADATEDLVINAGNSNAEIVLSRKGFTSLNDRLNAIQSNSPLRGVFSTVEELNAAFPSGVAGTCIVTGSNGVQEVNTLNVTAAPTSAGNITVTLNGVATNVAVDPATDTTTDAVAIKIRNTAFTGWTTGGTGSIVTFIKTTVGTNTTPSFSATTTAATATFTVTTAGKDTRTSDWYYWNGSAWLDGGVYMADQWQIPELNSRLNQVTKKVGEFTYVPQKISGGINYTNGTISTDNELLVYSEVDVSNAKSVTFRSTSFATDYGYAFYDSNGTYINGTGTKETVNGDVTVTVPEGATIFRFSWRIDGSQSVTVIYKNSILEEIYGDQNSLDLSKYTTNNWQISTAGKYANYLYTSKVIPVSDLNGIIKIKANANFYSEYAFIKDLTFVTGANVNFATGYDSVEKVTAGTMATIKVPDDAEYLYLLNKYNNVDIYLPDEIISIKNSILDNLNNIRVSKVSKICYVAASNSSDVDKVLADYVCTGTNDETVINQAIAYLTYGGTVQLLDGDYYIDAFPEPNYTAIDIKYNGNARVITVKGTTENKSYLSHYGVAIHVTQNAFNTIVDGNQYNVFNTANVKVPIGDWYAYPNNINFENFYLFLYDSSKKIIGINGQNFGSMDFVQVGIYNENYFYDRFHHLKPSTPNNGCIGVLSVRGANDEMARLGMNCLNVGGLYIGIKLSGVEHLIMKTCTAARNCYGYVFEGNCDKTLTMINCADEGNTHLPKFSGNGHLTNIDFCIERLSPDTIPDDPDANTEPYSTEVNLMGWKGFISYMIQGSAFGLTKFWKDGHGKNFKTVNLDHTINGTTRPASPEFMEQFFDTSINKMLTWNGSNWVDAMGNVIQ